MVAGYGGGVVWLVHARLGDSLAVELPALDRAALVRIQVPQPDHRLTRISVQSSLGCGASGRRFRKNVKGLV